jgi:subtilisin family serine protease
MGSLVAFSNDGIGFLAGMVGSVLLAIQRLGAKEWYEQFKEGVNSLKLQKQNTDHHVLVASNDDLREETSSNHSLVDVPRGAQ